MAIKKKAVAKKKVVAKKVVTKKAVVKKAPAKRLSLKEGAAPSPEAIRTWRQKKGMTQEQLGAKLGVSFLTVNRWEMGKFAPSEENAAKLNKLMR